MEFFILNLRRVMWLLAFIALSLHQPLLAQTQLYSESFETDGEGSRYTTNTYFEASPNCNFFARMAASPLDVCFQNNLFSGFQGSFFWGSEDIMRSGTPLPAGQITTSSINITSYGTLQVSLFLATANNVTPTNTRWETADSINIQASINGGAFRTVGRFMGDNVVGGNLVKDNNLNGAVDGGEPIVSVNAFTQHTFSIAGTGTSLRIRLDFDQIGGSEELGIDVIRVVGTIVVPVRWAGYAVEQVGDHARLNWETTEEVNTASYVIERSGEEGTFEPIGTVAAAGTAHSYSFVDEHPLPGNNLYRIRQVDQDNTTSYTEVMELRLEAPLSVSLFPNPSSELATLRFEGQPFTGTIVVSDALGQIVRQEKVQAVEAWELNTSNLPAGMYLVQVKDAVHSIKGQRLVVAH